MILITKEIGAQLLENGRKTMETGEGDFVPVLKLFNPVGAATWLLTEAHPSDPDILFGLC